MAPRTNGRAVQAEDTKICVVMVGLPARGKSYIAQKGTQYYLLFTTLNVETGMSNFIFHKFPFWKTP